MIIYEKVPGSGHTKDMEIRNGRNKCMIRKHIVFTGRVQGVGFRWRASQAASLYNCTGWCRNDWDGSVTMEIQGEEEAIDKVVRSIESSRYIWIQNMDVTPMYPEPDECRFRVE